MKQDGLVMDLNIMLHSQEEILKYMKGQNQKANINEASFVAWNDYAGDKSFFFSFHFIRTVNHDKGIWIIDTGASTHMCNDLNLFLQPLKLTKTNMITFPYGNTKSVTHSGLLNPKLHLIEALYTPIFNFNLLSVSKLANIFSIIV